MPDTNSPAMSPVEIEQGFSQLLTTQFMDVGADEEQDQQVAVDEGTDTTDELGATDAEDSEVVDDAEQVDDDESATDEPEFVLDLKVNGEDIRITDRAEAVKLAQLGKHFTQRNEAVIQRERQAEALEIEAAKARDQYAAYLPEIEAYLANPLGEAPKREAFTDELSYYKAKDKYIADKERVDTLRAERDRVAREQQEQRDRQLERWVREQDQRVLAEIPEWHDQAVMRAETQAMTEYALRAGISQQALQNPLLVRDAAFVKILRDAMRFQQVQTKGATEVKKVQTRVAPPGPAKAPGEGVSRRRKELEARAKSGKVDDVAPAMGHLMGRILEIQQTTNNRKRQR